MVFARSSRGFTLTEVAIALAVLAMAVGLVATSFSGATVAEMRAASARLASMSRAAYDEAALTGKIHRIAIEFQQTDAVGDVRKPATITVEATEEKLRFAEGESILARAAPRGGSLGGWAALSSGFAFGGDEDEGSLTPESLLPGGIDDLLGIAPRNDELSLDDDEPSPVDASFQKIAEPFTVDDGLVVLDVWTEGMEEPVSEGKTYVYYFPNGYAQDAMVHLGFADSDRTDAGFTVKIEALTGRTTVSDEYLEVPK